MKITDVELYPLRLRPHAGDEATGFRLLEAEGRALTAEQLAARRYGPPETVIVRLLTDAGVSGLGEGATLPHYFNLPLGGLIDWVKRLAKPLVGSNPLDLIRIHRIIDQVAGLGPPGCHPARAAIDMAVHDILGKVHGCPVHELLGGARRTSLELQTQMHAYTPEQQVAVCRYYLERGFRALKVKIGGRLRMEGYSKVGFDIEAAKLAAVVAALPADIAIDADANQAFGNAKLAAHLVERVLRAAFHPNLALEQPLRHLDLCGHAYLRRVLPVPVVLDESVVSPEAMLQIVRLEAADRIVLKINRVGGLWPARKIVAICEAAEIGISLDTMPFSLLGDTALCHLGATIRDPHPADVEGHTYFESNPFVGGITLSNGRAHLPDTPGLGIELDEDRLRPLLIPGLA